MGAGEKTLRWAGPILAVCAILFLPALRASAPLLPSAQWTVAELGVEAARATRPGTPGTDAKPSLRTVLRRAQALRQEFGDNRAASPQLGEALVLAAAIPATAILAGLCGFLCLLFQAFGRPRWLLGSALVGLAGTVYAIGASWWLTHAARLEVGRLMQQAQHSLGGLLGGLDWKSLQSGIATPLGLAPEAGLYLLAIAFLLIVVMTVGASAGTAAP